MSKEKIHRDSIAWGFSKEAAASPRDGADDEDEPPPPPPLAASVAAVVASSSTPPISSIVAASSDEVELSSSGHGGAHEEDDHLSELDEKKKKKKEEKQEMLRNAVAAKTKNDETKQDKKVAFSAQSDEGHVAASSGIKSRAARGSLGEADNANDRAEGNFHQNQNQNRGSLRRVSSAISSFFGAGGGSTKKDESQFELMERTDLETIDLVDLIGVLLDRDGGIERLPRKKGDRVFNEAFSGCSLVQWLMTNKYASSRGQGVAIGKALFRAGLIRHVTDEHGFEDQLFFYYQFDHECLLLRLRSLDSEPSTPVTRVIQAASVFRLPPLNASRPTSLNPDDKTAHLNIHDNGDNNLQIATVASSIPPALLPQAQQDDISMSNRAWARADSDSEGADVSPWEHGIKMYLEVEGSKLACLVVFLIATVIAWAEAFSIYRTKKAVDLLGWSLLLSRSTAQVVNLHCALLLLPVCRNLVTWLRETWVYRIIPLGKNLVFHRLIARAMIFFSLLHTIGHVRNVFILMHEDPQVCEEVYQIHMPFKKKESFWMWGFASIPGLTGVLLLLIEIAMVATSFSKFRNSRYNIFYNTHLLYVPFYILLVIHGAEQMLGPAASWRYVILPVGIYVIEWGIRVLRGYYRPVTVVQLLEEESGVYRIDLRPSKFMPYLPGQYLMVQCPQISSLEWHPFSITSPPDDDKVSLVIKRVGDWTTEVARVLNPTGRKAAIINAITDDRGVPLLRIDGPYGAPSEHVLSFRTVILIGAGIGATPFASVLRNIQTKYLATRGKTKHGVCCTTTRRSENGEHLEEGEGGGGGGGAAATGGVDEEAQQQLRCKCTCSCCDFQLEKVHFYWINRDLYSFEWFANVLVEAEDTLPSDFIEIRTFLTGRRASVVVAPREDGRDPVTGLKSPTQFHRPDIDGIFREAHLRYPHEEIGVFYCGPRNLSKTLYLAARKHSSIDGTRFKFFKENF